MYDGSLKEEELLDWIAAMDAYFDGEGIPNEQKVRLAKTKLKGHALLWWDHEEANRRKRGKTKVTSWDQMVAKLKGNFLPKDYEIQLNKRLQGLRQKEQDIKAYTDEFLKLNIRSGREEDEVVKVTRYLGGLRFNIQDDLVVANPSNVKECYQLALKVEENMKRRQDKAIRGRGNRNGRGRGTFSSHKPNNEEEGDVNKGKVQSFSNFRGGFGGNRGIFGRGFNQFSGRCYNCNEYGHPSFKCPEKGAASSSSSRRVAYAQEEEVSDSP
ncbi:uncharacterized protein LOC131857900 [Cryptomeria japonica]|uniref:uncharacterized protein LOC131857900 n=1 Tax=Cryptomeria japonica TaxID=3369 RepID=UPI0027DA5ED5|nr:uncharacterized protein LOC131857900 [Cryptomeria japonica]